MMSEPSMIPYSTLVPGAEVILCRTQGKLNKSCSRDPTVSAAQTHLARTLKPARGSIMLPDNTVVEREQFFGAADSVILDQPLPNLLASPGTLQAAHEEKVRYADEAVTREQSSEIVASTRASHRNDTVIRASWPENKDEYGKAGSLRWA